jgi:hypothetical protein
MYSNIKELRSLCQSTAPAPGNEAIIGKFSRIFSIYFTALFLRTQITPNQITVLSSIVFFVGLGFFYFADLWLHVLGVFIVFFSVVLDGADGEVARFRKNTRPSGTVYVEPVSHDIQYGLMFIIIAAALWLRSGSALVLFLGSIAGISKLLYRLIEVRYWFAFQEYNIPKEQLAQLRYEHKGKKWPVRVFYWVNKNVFGSAGLVGPLALFVIIKKVDIFLWIYTIGFLFLFIALFFKHVLRISREHL